jgi:FO synthase
MSDNDRLSSKDALALANIGGDALGPLLEKAAALRDSGHGDIVSYSRKVFIPLTQLCRDVCHYCTFAKAPKKLKRAYMTPDEVLAIARAGQAAGCKEALFTLGDKPELRYGQARKELQELGFETTLEYLSHMAQLVLQETGLMPHINAGVMTGDEIAMLKGVSISQGLMLESSAERLSEKGGPHFGSPDKEPAARLQALTQAGVHQVPTTSGLLLGIGETRKEYIKSLLALRDLHDKYGHIQEIIVQNFRAKPDTAMAEWVEPSPDLMLWAVAAARLVFGPHMNIQAPPNLSPGLIGRLIGAGINDWGGISPVTPDHVNPEAPWPHLDAIAAETKLAGKTLVERLAVYPDYIFSDVEWITPDFKSRVFDHINAGGYVRSDSWSPGEESTIPKFEIDKRSPHAQDSLSRILSKASEGRDLEESEILTLFDARGGDFSRVCAAADELRRDVNGDTVSYVVNRNINYTNVCYFRCGFCAFSKGKMSENLRGRPYDLGLDEIVRRTSEAKDRGATEVCLQGGIHPAYTGETYLGIVRAINQAFPDMHIHAFSPLEVWHGAETLGLSLTEYLHKLAEAGLGTLPGTAAEILDDEVREVLCHDKINTRQWIDVIEASHNVGLRTTSTIMYGHIERTHHWVRHLLHLRNLQKRTGGITEFVPLPFVHLEAPIYLKGRARKGPTFREAVLMHAVARLALHPHITNIQTSWVKMGHAGVAASLNAGVNDLGGTLMNESISRAAGSTHGQEMPPEPMEAMITGLGRNPRQRTTLYEDAPEESVAASFNAPPLTPIINTEPKRDKSPVENPELIRAGE